MPGADITQSLVPPIDTDRIRNGDAAATADAIRVLRDAVNAEITARSQIVSNWKDIAYDASAFLASSGSLTVTADLVADFKYLKFGTMIVLAFHFNRSTPGGVAMVTSGTPTTLGVRIPELRAKLSRRGAASDASGYNGCFINDSVGAAAGDCYVTRQWNSIDEPACVLNIEVASGRNFNSTTVGIAAFGFCIFEIEG